MKKDFITTQTDDDMKKLFMKKLMTDTNVKTVLLRPIQKIFLDNTFAKIIKKFEDYS